MSTRKETKATPALLPQTQLKAFLKNYPLGLKDWHLPVFRETQRYCCPSSSSTCGSAGAGASHQVAKNFTVLYPGCHRHITPSLIFPMVKYVDCDRKIAPLYSDPAVLQWLDEHKEHSATTKATNPSPRAPSAATTAGAVAAGGSSFLVEFQRATYVSDLKPKFAPKFDCFDLMISACAGIVTTPCHKYLKPGGHFLVSDAHFDARTAFMLDKVFKLVGVFDDQTGKLRTDQSDLDGHFMTTHASTRRKSGNVSQGPKVGGADTAEDEGKNTAAGTPITAEMVQQSIDLPKSKWPFNLKKSAMFYLFEKNETVASTGATSTSDTRCKHKQRSDEQPEEVKRGKRDRDTHLS